jgi:hypothetical protein
LTRVVTARVGVRASPDAETARGRPGVPAAPAGKAPGPLLGRTLDPETDPGLAVELARSAGARPNAVVAATSVAAMSATRAAAAVIGTNETGATNATEGIAVRAGSARTVVIGGNAGTAARAGIVAAGASVTDARMTDARMTDARMTDAGVTWTAGRREDVTAVRVMGADVKVPAVTEGPGAAPRTAAGATSAHVGRARVSRRPSEGVVPA